MERSKKKRRWCPKNKEQSSPKNTQVFINSPERVNNVLGSVEVRVEQINESDESSEHEPLIIDSIFKLDDIKYVEDYPENKEDREKFKYNWPICLRYIKPLNSFLFANFLLLHLNKKFYLIYYNFFIIQIFEINCILIKY